MEPGDQLAAILFASLVLFAMVVPVGLWAVQLYEQIKGKK